MDESRNPMFRIFKILLSLLLILLSVLFVVQLHRLNILPPVYFMPIVLVVVTIDVLIVGFLNFFSHSQKVQIVLSVLAAVLSIVYGFGSYTLSGADNALGFLTSENGKVKNTIRVYALKDSPIEDEQDLAGQKLGILQTINKAGTEKLIDSLEEQDISVTTEEYPNFGPLADALYQEEVNAIVVNDVYVNNITELEKFTDFNQKTKVVYTFEYYTDLVGSANSVTSITKEPFTVMINGSDSREGLGNTDRSDVNMLATINPTTGVVLLVSIPRDAYVVTVCDPEYDCLNGQYDKLTHTGIHTYNTTKATIENLLGVDINYTFRANFMAVVDIVDALGGIDVNVAEGYAVDHFWTNDMFGTDYGVHEGINHLNGQQALMYARERYAYLEGDFQRIRNQQEVLTQIAKKATSPEGIARYSALLDTIDGNFWTDLSQQEISELIQFQISQGPEWAFISYSLSGRSDNLYAAEAYNTASVVVLDQNTVRFARELIEAVKEGKSVEELEDMLEEFVPGYGDFELDENAQQPTVEPETEYVPVQEPVIPYTPPVYEPVIPYEPVPEVPVEPVPEVPVEPVPEVPVEPEPEVPVEPEPEVPVEPTPEPEVPVDPVPEPEVPVDPVPEVPTDPAAEQPIVDPAADQGLTPPIVDNSDVPAAQSEEPASDFQVVAP